MTTNTKSSNNDYILAQIHKGFYYNEELDTPTLIKEYHRVEKIFLESSFIACICARM